jgi:hypothetical protein
MPRVKFIGWPIQRRELLVVVATWSEDITFVCSLPSPLPRGEGIGGEGALIGPLQCVLLPFWQLVTRTIFPHLRQT